MLFQIPQFIETEDKIVGPFSLKQFAYVFGALGISALLYFLVNTWLWFVLSLPLVAAGVTLAFIKINGQPFTRVALSAFGYYFKPQTYVWQPQNPTIKKNEEAMKSLAGGFSWESIMSGLALKQARERVQTGTKETTQKLKRSLGDVAQKYSAIERLTGERYLAKRVDYR